MESGSNGLSFVDDPQMSVREKIDRYFLKKKAAIPVEVLDESTSDESFVNSFSNLDESFAEILNNNPHINSIRNAKKENTKQPESDRKEQDSEPYSQHQLSYEELFEKTFHEKPPQQQQQQKSPYMPTPTRRGQVRRPIKTDDSIEMDPNDMWYVSDESFLEMEKACESPTGAAERAAHFNDTTLLCDIEAPSFMCKGSDSDESLDDSVFVDRPLSHSILSPMQQVALRRPSTILEESTIQSINSSEERSVRSSLSLRKSVNAADEFSKSVTARSYRPSILNVFPTRSRIGFYDNSDSSSSTSVVNTSINKENSLCLMTFDSVDQESPPPPPPSSSQQRDRPAPLNSSISLMQFDSIDEASHSNLSVDQTQHDSSMSDSEPPDQFNDTLEAVDYYMKQGKKLLDRTSASTALHQQPCVVVSSPKNRNNSLLKQTLARRHLMSMNGDTKLANKKLF